MMGAAGLGSIPKAVGGIIGGMPLLGGPGLLRPPLGGVLPGLIRPGAAPLVSLAASTSKAPAPAGPLSKAVAPGLVPPAGGSVAVPPLGEPQPCTVYVGRISSEVSDDFVKHLLEKCGKISKWNRAADPNTSKLTSFGFCDFEEPEGVWRALEFLHEQQLCDKRLLVKCEEKAKQTIEAWKASKQDTLAKKRKEGDDEKKEGDDEKKEGNDEKKESDEKKDEVSPLTEEQLVEELRKEGTSIAEDIARVLKDKNKNFPELKKGDGEDVKEGEKKEGEKKEDSEKKEEGDKKEEDKKDGDDKKDHRRDGRGRQRSRTPKKRSESEEARRAEQERKRAKALSKYYRVSRRERDREGRVRDRDRDIEKEYQYRIREFERGEGKRIDNLKRDFRDLQPPPEPSDREVRKFQDRDLDFGRDDKDDRDWKRYREDRASKRSREQEKDIEDQAAEEKEIAEERREKEEEDRKRRKEEEETKRKAREEAEAEHRRQRDEEKARLDAERKKEEEELNRKRAEEKKIRDEDSKKVQEAAAAKLIQKVSAEVQEEMRTMQSDQALSAAKGIAPTGVTALFRAGEDQQKPLTRLDGGGGGEIKLKDDEMRRLIQQVPTDKKRAFEFKIDWTAVAENRIVEKKLRPWVKKKVSEYLGADEGGMVEFILKKVAMGTEPESILAELEGFLDEEAENFTLKMWRMLIFEVLRVKAR